MPNPPEMQMEHSGVYLAYLIEVDRNSATIALHTIWTGKSNEDSELRCASLLEASKIPRVIESMDRGVHEVKSWTDFYRWLGSGQQWASFTILDAAKFAPHWFHESAVYVCNRVPESMTAPDVIAFVDKKCKADIATIRAIKAYRDADPNAFGHIVSFYGNLVATTQPLFA
jgi:hypothetical protein